MVLAVNNFKLGFASHLGSSYINPNDHTNAMGNYCNDTFFFRDSNQLEFVHQYLKKVFPQGTHIADYGCSDGEETYSLAMIIEEINPENNPKYTITAYDPSIRMIKRAKNGEYKINIGDNFLISERKHKLSPRKLVYKKMFHEHFIPVEKNTYRLKDGAFDGWVDFAGVEKGNIDQIDKAYKNKPKPGVIIFKNAWYHILENINHEFFVTRKKEIDTLKSILTKIHENLDDNGILVVGNLGRDHMVDNRLFSSGIVDNSRFHRALYNCGFVPMKGSEESTDLNDIVKVYTIWKKAPQQEEEKKEKRFPFPLNYWRCKTNN